MDAPLDGMIHISEVSWEKVDELVSKYHVGQKIDAIVLGSDSDTKRLELSIKRLTSDPFEEIVKEYQVDKKVTGTVTEISDAGLTLTLPAVAGITVEGMIRKEKIPPTTHYEVGQHVEATVIQLDARKRRVLLTPVLKEKPLMYR
jgi:small subunit ribosomal protein S1